MREMFWQECELAISGAMVRAILHCLPVKQRPPHRDRCFANPDRKQSVLVCRQCPAAADWSHRWSLSVDCSSNLYRYDRVTVGHETLRTGSERY